MVSQFPDTKIPAQAPVRAPSSVPVDDAALPFEVAPLDLRGRLTRLPRPAGRVPQRSALWYNKCVDLLSVSVTARESAGEPYTLVEIAGEASDPGEALALVGAARRIGIAAKAREVRGVDRVVVKDGDAIAHLLTRLGAHASVLSWEERRVRREVRATANRLANFDDANLRRSARAAVAAAARVTRALEILGDAAPNHLTSAGELRLEHRQASLEELGALADPPLTKDAIAGRIRRLLALADKRARDLGVPDTEAAVTPEMLAVDA